MSAHPLPLLTHDGKAWKLGPEAAKMLRSVAGNEIVVVAVAGQARTGKSYLLNKLIGQQKGFEIGSTVHACTKGIFVWSTPLFVQRAGVRVPVVLIDTEGLNSISQDQTRDAEIMSLALLLSSYFVYNSVGTIDEAALDRLSLMAHLSDRIAVSSNKKDAQTNARELAYYFPTLHWVLRDFALDLVDESGKRAISETEYLELALQTRSKDVAKNEIRNAIRTFFPSRDCTTLPRPVVSEADLRRVDELPATSLRPEFRAKMDTLRSRILDEAPVKKIDGHAVSGAMLVELIGAYVTRINGGGVPCIGSAWAAVSQLAAQGALDEAIKRYVAGINELVKELPIDASELAAVHGRCSTDALALFDSTSLPSAAATSCRAKLLTRLEEERLKLVARNDAESGTFCRAQLALLTDRLEERVRSGALATVSAVVDAWQELVAVYLKLAKGSHAHTTLTAALTSALPRTVLHVGSRDAERRDKEAAKQLDTLRQQLERAVKAEEEAKARLRADEELSGRSKKEADAARKDAERRVAEAEARLQTMRLEADRRLAEVEGRLRSRDDELASERGRAGAAEERARAAEAKRQRVEDDLRASRTREADLERQLAAAARAPAAAPAVAPSSRGNGRSAVQAMDVDDDEDEEDYRNDGGGVDDDDDDDDDDDGDRDNGKDGHDQAEGVPAVPKRVRREAPSTKKIKADGKGTGSVSVGVGDIDKMTVPQLKRALMDSGIMPDRSGRKADLVAQLRKAK